MKYAQTIDFRRISHTVHLAIDYGNTKTDDDEGGATDVWVDLIMLSSVMIRDLFRNLLEYEKKHNGI